MRKKEILREVEETIGTIRMHCPKKQNQAVFPCCPGSRVAVQDLRTRTWTSTVRGAVEMDRDTLILKPQDVTKIEVRLVSLKQVSSPINTVIKHRLHIRAKLISCDRQANDLKPSVHG